MKNVHALFLASIVMGSPCLAAAKPQLIGCTIELGGQPGDLKPTSSPGLPKIYLIDRDRQSAEVVEGRFASKGPAVIESWTDRLIVFSRLTVVQSNSEMKIIERIRLDQFGRFEMTYDHQNARGQTMMHLDAIEGLKKSDAFFLPHPGLTYAGKCKDFPS
jgi:hypothetical protein